MADSDAQVARALRMSAVQLEQVANGLDHLQVLIPALAREARAQAAAVGRIAEALDRVGDAA